MSGRLAPRTRTRARARRSAASEGLEAEKGARAPGHAMTPRQPWLSGGVGPALWPRLAERRSGKRRPPRQCFLSGMRASRRPPGPSSVPGEPDPASPAPRLQGPQNDAAVPLSSRTFFLSKQVIFNLSRSPPMQDPEIVVLKDKRSLS